MKERFKSQVVIPPPEPVLEVPDQTEVRFFHPDDEPNARAVVESLKAQGKVANIRDLSKSAPLGQTTGDIEVWLGKKQ